MKKQVQIVREKWYYPSRVFQALFCEIKTGGIGKEFSVKKFLAFTFLTFSFIDHGVARVFPEWHWTAHLRASDTVKVALIVSFDALSAWALTVYTAAKAKNKA